MMVVATVRVKVKPAHVDAFVKATVRNHEFSIRENGNMRFDVLRSTDDPTLFLLYEAYATAEQAAAHKKTGHYLEWRDTVASWMAEPRQSTPYQPVRP
jgi:autoinducer 2-degrading protein